MNKFLAIYGKPRYLGIITSDSDLAKGDVLIVESPRGEEFAVVAGEITDEQESSYRQLKNTAEHGDNGPKNYEPVVSDLRLISEAVQEDFEEAERYKSEEEDALREAKDILYDHDLDMKLIDVEYLIKKRKLFIYFSSEQRVDFRSYVRDLAREFKTRIELRQVGVRDEAKIIKGLGPCGQPCCCSYWLYQFSPICIRMVKEQNLALNPSKISGLCGRLMCCMHYEHDVYHSLWKGLPNPGSKIKAPNGNITVAGVDLVDGSVRCMIPGKGETKVPTDKFEEFKKTVMAGEEWEEEKPADLFPEPDSVPFPEPEFKDGREPDGSKRKPERHGRDESQSGNKIDKKPSEGREGEPRKRKRRRRPRKPKGDSRTRNKRGQPRSEQSGKDGDTGGNRKSSTKRRSRRPRSRRSNKNENRRKDDSKDDK